VKFCFAPRRSAYHRAQLRIRRCRTLIGRTTMLLTA
jgi:hypothetical protein